jgi:hypothetical protein
MAKPPTVTAAQLRDALYRKQAALEAQDKAALAKQIELEKAGHAPVERLAARPEIEIARSLLNGSGDLLSQPGTAPGVELWETMLLRRGIRLALTTLQNEELRLGTLGLSEWMAGGGLDRWLANRRGLADALLTVQRFITEGAAIRTEAVAAAGGQAVQLPSDRGDRSVLSLQGIAVLEAIQREVIKNEPRQ